MEKSTKNVDPKKRSSKNTPSQDEELTIRKRPLEILIDEAEMSESSDSKFGDIVPLTPPPPTPPLPLPPLNPPSPVVDEPIENEQEPTVQTDSDEDYLEEEEDDDKSDEEFFILKKYYAYAVGKTDHEKYYIMFCDHLKNIIGSCKKDRLSCIHNM